MKRRASEDVGNILSGNFDSRDLAHPGGIVTVDRRLLDLLIQRFYRALDLLTGRRPRLHGRRHR